MKVDVQTIERDLTVDREAVYDAEVAPLVDALFDACQRAGIPAVAAFQFSENGIARCVAVPSNAHVVIMDLVRVIAPEVFEDQDPAN